MSAGLSLLPSSPMSENHGNDVTVPPSPVAAGQNASYNNALTVQHTDLINDAPPERFRRVFLDPAASMNAFQVMYRGLKTSDSPYTSDDVLQLGADIKDCFPVTGSQDFKPQRCTVLYAGFESGLLRFLCEAMQDSSFFHQSEDMCVLILDMFAAFVNSFNIRAPVGMDPTEGRRLQDAFLDSVLDEPWKGLLLHRTLIRRGAGIDRQVSALALDATMLVDIYYARGRVKEVYGSPLAQLLLYIWVSAPPNAGDMPGLVLEKLSHEKQGQKSIHTSSSFMNKALEMHGGERIAAAIKRGVDRAITGGWSFYEGALIRVMHAFTAYPQCLLALTKVPLIRSLVQGAIALWHENDYRAVTFWVAGSSIIRNADDVAKAGTQQAPASTMITPPDVLSPFLALGVLLWTCPPPAEGIMMIGQFDTKLHFTIPDHLSYMFRLHSGRMRTSNHLDFYRRAQEAIEPLAYFGVLRALHQAMGQPRINLDMPTLAWLATVWQEWGKNAGIDENSAQAAWSKTRERRCEWVQCRYHAQLASSTLRECKGCGVARYCSKDCQVKDWKRGGHKERCRRLKS